MKIVAWDDPGSLGASGSEPTVYQWKLRYQAPGLLGWGILLLLLLLFKANRRPQAWLVLIPLIVLYFIWSLILPILPFVSEEAKTFDQIVTSLGLALAILWLLGPIPAKLSGAVFFFSGLGIMTAAGLLSTFTYNGTDFSPETAPFLIIYVFEVLVMLLGLTVAAHFCRKRYSVPRFLGQLALWMLVLSIGLILVSVAVVMLLQSALRDDWEIWLQAPLVGAILGGASYLLILPFLSLSCFSSFHRERFYRLFRLPMPIAVHQVAGDNANMESEPPDSVSSTK